MTTCDIKQRKSQELSSVAVCKVVLTKKNKMKKNRGYNWKRSNSTEVLRANINEPKKCLTMNVFIFTHGNTHITSAKQCQVVQRTENKAENGRV